MSDPAYRPPSALETSFNCPHCGALAKQFYARQLEKDSVPINFTAEQAEEFAKDIEDRELAQSLRKYAQKISTGLPFLEEKSRDPYTRDVLNLNISQCYNCEDLSVWVGSKILYPDLVRTHRPNSDLPEDIRADYIEAARILDISPRGSAALLRLSIQKLCKFLGGQGKNINEDIAFLVENGLDRRVQQALDVVRVVGNNAVHPGQIDVNDSSSSAEKLFGLVNLIAEIMITQPKHVEELYNGLPEGARAAIDRRDSKGTI